MDHRLFRPKSTTQVESIYQRAAPNLLNSFTFVTRSQVLEGVDPEESMLLQPGAHKLVAENLQVPQLAAEVERAIRQVKESLDQEAKHERQTIQEASKEKEDLRK